MFTYEEKKKAVELYLKYESISAVINELGYPNRHSLRKWVEEYKRTNTINIKQTRKKKYSEEEIEYAVNYYVEHGKNMMKTIRDIGYPNRNYLKKWVIERTNQYKSNHIYNKSQVNLSPDDKVEAVINLCTRNTSVKNIAADIGVVPSTLYNWKKNIFPKEVPVMTDKNNTDSTKELKDSIKELQQQASELQKEVYRLKLEKEVLEVAAELIKKDQGVSLNNLTNKEKTIVIDTLRNKYSLKSLLTTVKMAKSSYEYQRKSINKPDKYKELKELVKEIFEKAYNSYGYRRIHASLKNDNHMVSEKVIRRIMKEESLIVKTKRKGKYSSYKGEITPAVENLVKRNFHSDSPNKLWLSDITEFHIPSGKIYLSPIIDCFDGMPVAWSLGTSPSAELANTMLLDSIKTLKDNEHPIVHTDRGSHYRWPEWIRIMEENNLTRSMSKKGCSPDNSACEGFFGRLKNEMFYNRDWKGVSIEKFIELVNEYIEWYCTKRIKLSLGGLSPLQYRERLGII